MPPVPFGALRQLLLDLGFTQRVESAGATRFEHAETRGWFVFPPLGELDAVPTPHVVSVRKILDDRGLFPRDEFDEWVRTGLVAG